MFVNFKKIIVSNFFSISDEIELQYTLGLTLIQGYNRDKNSRNGVGKSALILDSIFWALFGEAFRKVKQSEIKNRKGGTTSVKLFFNIGPDEYELTRRIPTSISLIKNEEDITRSVEETNKEIEKIIQCNEKFARNALFLDTRSHSFLSETPTNRQKFLESIFDLSVLRDMLEMARSDKNKMQKKIDSLYSIIEEKRAGKTRLELLISQERERYSSFLSQFEQERKYLLDQIQNYDTSEIPSLSSERENYQTGLIDLTNALDKLNTSIIETRKEIELKRKSISEVPPDFCPACKRKFDAVDTGTCAQTLQDEITKLTKKLSKHQSAFSEVKSCIEESNNEISSISSKIEKIQSGLIPIENKLSDIERKINSVPDFSPIESEITKYSEEIITMDAEFQNSLSEMEIQTNVIALLGEEGIKAYIIPKILNRFNLILSNYANVFNFPYDIKVEKNFDISIHQKQREISYGSLSGGESKRIDIAVLLALQDIRKIATGFDCNIFVCDELLDSSIDEVGIVSILDLLRERAITNKHCIFFITHRDSVSFSFDRIINLEKYNRETRLVDTRYINNK
jgi:DNA repair exonuclease SbcCD ATPase subunit